MLDVDDAIVAVHGYAKRGSGFGYVGVRGLNALLVTLVTATMAPVIVVQRLRKGATGSPRGAQRLVGDAVKTARRLLGNTRLVLVRMDSAFSRRGVRSSVQAVGPPERIKMDPVAEEIAPAEGVTGRDVPDHRHLRRPRGRAGRTAQPDPGAQLPTGGAATICLDFVGAATTGSAWNTETGQTTMVSPAYTSNTDPTTFTAEELIQIQRAWAVVAEAYAPSTSTSPPPLPR